MEAEINDDLKTVASVLHEWSNGDLTSDQAMSILHLDSEAELLEAAHGSEVPPPMPKGTEALLHEINASWDELVADLARSLRVDHIPVRAGWRSRDLELYERFLDGDPAEQASILAEVPEHERPFYEELREARQGFEQIEVR